MRFFLGHRLFGGFYSGVSVRFHPSRISGGGLDALEVAGYLFLIGLLFCCWAAR